MRNGPPLGLSIGIAWLALAGVIAPVFAKDVPAHTGLVVDQAGLLDPGLQDQLEGSLRQFQKEVGPQIQLLTVVSLDGEPIESYSIHVADAWKLGDKKRDDGVILLVAAKDRAVRIEVGRGLEGQLPDITSGRIISETIVPRFKEGNYPAGISDGLQAIAHAIGGELHAMPVYSRPAAQRSGNEGAFLFVLFIVLFLILPRVFASRRSSGGFWSGLLLGNILGSRSRGGFFGGGGGGGFGGGGGGFGGGGGGGFSGGGASGSW